MNSLSVAQWWLQASSEHGFVILNKVSNAINSVRVHFSLSHSQFFFSFVCAYSWGTQARDAAALEPLHLPSLSGRARAQVSCRRFAEALHVLKVGVICESEKWEEVVKTVSHIIMSSGRGGNILTFLSFFEGCSSPEHRTT